MLERIKTFGAFAILIFWLCQLVYGIAAAIRAGRGHQMLFQWAGGIAIVGLGELLYYLYLNYAPSTFFDHRAIDASPQPPRKLEQLARQMQQLVKKLFAIAAVFIVILNSVEWLTGKIGWHIRMLVCLITFTAFTTWLLILELYIRYASSILSDRNVIPIPFSRRHG